LSKYKNNIFKPKIYEAEGTGIGYAGDITLKVKAYKKKDYEAFMTCIKEIPKQLPYEFKKKFEVFKRFKNGIYQAFMTGYSNGAIEGTNNLIKVIKRVAYGYRNFENMKLRIKIIKGCFFTPVNRKSL